MPKPKKLTSQQEAFARWVVRGHSQAEAYRRSYKVGPKTLDATVQSEASRLARNPTISARIEEMRAQAASRAAVTVESMLVEMGFNHERAVDAGDTGAANTASRDRARLAGLFKDDPANRTLAVTINIDASDKGLL